MKIIDAHSHLGDNQYPRGGDIIEQIGIKQKKFDSAVATLKKRIQQNPKDAFSYNLLDKVYSERKNSNLN